jgi:hypothetical protein
MHVCCRLLYGMEQPLAAKGSAVEFLVYTPQQSLLTPKNTGLQHLALSSFLVSKLKLQSC